MWEASVRFFRAQHIYMHMSSLRTLTCLRAAFASRASAESVAMETSAVGVEAAGIAVGGRRGVPVRESSSGGVPPEKKQQQQTTQKKKILSKQNTIQSKIE